MQQLFLLQSNILLDNDIQYHYFQHSRRCAIAQIHEGRHPEDPMTNDHFAGANLMDLGTQMARVWQKNLEDWWRAMLSDPGRLSELAGRLGEMGFGTGAKTGASAGDLSRLVEALELMDRRMQKLEKHVGALAENLSSMMTLLEASSDSRSRKKGS
jgi:hypothetical protein